MVILTMNVQGCYGYYIACNAKISASKQFSSFRRVVVSGYLVSVVVCGCKYKCKIDRNALIFEVKRAKRCRTDLKIFVTDTGFSNFFKI